MRAIAALHVIPLHLLVRGHSEIRSVTDLRRGMVRPFSLSRMPVQELLFTALGVDPQAVARNARPLTELARLVSEWTTGVATVGYYYPSEIVQAALKRGARLLPIEGPEIERIRREYRFVRQVTIPAGTYPGYSRPIRTIGVDTLYICRSDLDDAVAYELTKRLFDALPALSQKFPGLRVFDVEQAPATPIPLH